MRSDYLRALRINRCIKKKTTVHNWKKNDRPDSTSANCGHPTVQKKVLEESSTSSSLDTSEMCPGAREQIFLHGWITCHANNQGRKELSNALPFARMACLEPRTPYNSKTEIKNLQNEKSLFALDYRKLKKTQLFPVQPPRRFCLPLYYRTDLSTTTDCHHSDGTSKHRDTSMTFAERSTSNCHEFSRRKVKTNNYIIP